MWVLLPKFEKRIQQILRFWEKSFFLKIGKKIENSKVKVAMGQNTFVFFLQHPLQLSNAQQNFQNDLTKEILSVKFADSAS